MPKPPNVTPASGLADRRRARFTSPRSYPAGPPSRSEATPGTWARRCRFTRPLDRWVSRLGRPISSARPNRHFRCRYLPLAGEGGSSGRGEDIAGRCVEQHRPSGDGRAGEPSGQPRDPWPKAIGRGRRTPKADQGIPDGDRCVPARHRRSPCRLRSSAWRPASTLLLLNILELSARRSSETSPRRRSSTCPKTRPADRGCRSNCVTENDRSGGRNSASQVSSP
jgi:hypothetical protein